MHFRHASRIALALFGAASLAACNGSPSDAEPIIPTLPSAPENTILLFDNFDSENPGGGHMGRGGQNNWSNFQNWTVVDGCVDLHGNGFFDVQAGNGLYVDLDGSCTKGGTIETKNAYNLVAGTYTLEFWLAGNNRNDAPDTVNVSLTGTSYTEQFVLPRGQAFRSHSRNVVVTAPTSARIRFHNRGGDDQGALLDMVRLRRVQ